MTPTELNALAEKVEALDGPSRDNEWRIQKALGIGRWPAIEMWPPFMEGSKADLEIPRYTTSLDAAMTLAPEGWNWMAGNRNQPSARAYVENGEPAFEGAAFRKNPKRQWFEVVAATPALALCSAALRARAASLLTEQGA